MKYKAKVIDGKMMLISRDIQAGDTFTGNVGRIWKDCHECDAKVAREANKNNSEYGKGSYKVMGNVSLQATWVKEGDEFEHNVDCWISNSEIDQPDTFKIKGPCGHYH